MATIVYHENMERQIIDNCTTKDCYEFNVTYQGSFDQISSLIDSSQSCLQMIRVKKSRLNAGLDITFKIYLSSLIAICHNSLTLENGLTDTMKGRCTFLVQVMDKRHVIVALKNQINVSNF